MQTRQLIDGLSVAPQLDIADMAALAALGFRGVINNRPDGEEAGQPAAAALRAAATAVGLTYLHLPVISGQLSEAQAETFGSALQTLPQPVLAFCRTGTRSTMLWALDAAQRGVAVDVILDTAAHAGYDLSAFRPRLQLAGA
jgi:uncharacterized protein (TIGR01244 family)